MGCQPQDNHPPVQGKKLAVHQQWLLFTLMLAIVTSAVLPQATDAKTTLRGSARVDTRFDEPMLSGQAYYPRQSAILKADTLVADFKLKAAEAIYWQAMTDNHRNAGAWNGLGKVAYYKTASSNQNLRSETRMLQDEAVQYFLSALRYQPNYVEAHVNLASVYMEQGRLGEAGDALERALKLSPNDENVLSHYGEWLLKADRPHEAIAYLKRAIKLNSASAASHYHLAMAHVARHEIDDALQNLNTTLWLEPNHALAHHQMASIYEGQDNGAAAVEHYLKALSLKPEMHQTRLKLADYYEQRGDLASAIEQLKNIIDSSDPNWALTERVARLSFQLEQPEVAVQYYRNWMNDHPEDAEKAKTALSLAKTQVAKKKLRDDDLISQGEAKRYAEQAMQYQPNNFEARMINAKLDREIGAPSPIQGKDPAMVDVALQKPVYHPYQSFEKGELLLARYQFRDAEQAFRIARHTGEGNRGDMIFGELFLNKGLPALAKEAFTQVLMQLPDNASARLGLAKAQEAQKESMELVAGARQNVRRRTLPVAVMQCEKALKADVKNSAAHYLVASLYEKTSNYALAADHYYAYMQLEPHADNIPSVRRRIADLKQRLGKQYTLGRY